MCSFSDGIVKLVLRALNVRVYLSPDPKELDKQCFARDYKNFLISGAENLKREFPIDKVGGVYAYGFLYKILYPIVAK